MTPTKTALYSFGKQNSIIYIVVLVAIVVGCWSPVLGFFLFLFGLIGVPLSMVAAGAALAVRLWRAGGTRPMLVRGAMAVSIAPLATFAAMALLLPLFRVGTWLGSASLLLAYGDSYAAIISQVQHTPPPTGRFGGWRHEGTITYVVDYGTPRRVAFEPSGFLDNWSGIVWDPSHDVLKADGFDAKTGRFRAPDRITKLFGGDLVGCRRLGGDWFLCSFT